MDDRERALRDAIAAVESCRDGYGMAIGASPEPPERYWLPRDAVIKAIEALGDGSLTSLRVTEPTCVRHGEQVKPG